MKETLRELWRGDVRPFEERYVNVEEEREIQFEITRLKERLRKEYDVGADIL